jgi:hypothetical protein
VARLGVWEQAGIFEHRSLVFDFSADLSQRVLPNDPQRVTAVFSPVYQGSVAPPVPQTETITLSPSTEPALYQGIVLHDLIQPYTMARRDWGTLLGSEWWALANSTAMRLGVLEVRYKVNRRFRNNGRA